MSTHIVEVEQIYSMSVRVKSWLHICVALLLLFLHVSVAFYSVGTSSATSSRTHLFRLFMGRAANVRAATKSKTDAAKAKKNNRYAKKVNFHEIYYPCAMTLY